MQSDDMLLNGPSNADCTIILAHGAGAPMDTPFMDFFAEGLGARGYQVARFEFPYMAARRTSGKKRPPDREPVLREAWLSAIERMRNGSMVIGGKSMGGRIASLIADAANVDGLVCLGYPFHPVGKPDRLRVEHLQAIRTPTLIVQGTRDAFGKPEEVAGYDLSARLNIHWLEDGDHSFKPRKSSGRTELQNWAEGVDAIQRFLP
jgi:predicted alpha/beta-hydrolase family hydrolase